MSKFLVADDHPLFREALLAALTLQFPKVTFFESDSLDSTLSALRENKGISLVILDLNMPGCENYYGLLKVKQNYPNIPVAVLSASDSIEVIQQVIAYGANGFISKATSTKTITKALKAIIDGEQWIPESLASSINDVAEDVKRIASKIKELTPKQFQVLRRVGSGLNNKQIAESLHVTEATIKAHIGAIFKKLDVTNRTQIALAIEKLQLV